MEPVTVEIVSTVGIRTFLNCGVINQYPNATSIYMEGHVLHFSATLENPLDVAQRFADLLVDVTA